MQELESRLRRLLHDARILLGLLLALLFGFVIWGVVLIFQRAYISFSHLSVGIGALGAGFFLISYSVRRTLRDLGTEVSFSRTVSMIFKPPPRIPVKSEVEFPRKRIVKPPPKPPVKPPAPELEQKVYDYARERGGKIVKQKCVAELGITEDEFDAALNSLIKARKVRIKRKAPLAG